MILLRPSRLPIRRQDDPYAAAIAPVGGVCHPHGIAAATVHALRTTPVKGLRVVERDAVDLAPEGVPEDRRFYLVDERDRMVNAKHLGTLNEVVADYDHAARTLELRFPGGARVAGEIALGEPLQTRFYSRPAAAREVLGAFGAALSEHAGRALRIVEGLDRSGVDRGRDGAVSLLSRASLDAFARLAGGPVDARRFRMLVEVDGLAEPHEEDTWVGARIAIGDAVVRVRGHVGRCNITERHPETGRQDLGTLDLLRSYRADLETSEPLAFGVYGDVLQAGRVAVGDAVTTR